MSWNDSWNNALNGTFLNDSFFFNFSSTSVDVLYPTSIPTAPTLEPTKYVEYFCEISSKFELTTWYWVAILALPMFGFFFFIYYKLGLPIRSNKWVKLSLIQSTFTYSGVAAMIIVNYETESKYDYCPNPLTGDDFSSYMELGFEVDVIGFFWFITNCISLFFFILLYLFKLNKQVEEHVDGIKESSNCCVKHCTKFLAFIISFGLSALYKPFEKTGSYYNPDTLESVSKCSCIDEYIYEISNLAFWLIISPLALKIGKWCLHLDDEDKLNGKTKDSDVTCPCVVGSILYYFAACTIITAPVLIVYLRIISIIDGVIEPVLYIWDSINSKSNKNNDDDDFNNVGDALVSLLKVEYLVFFIAILHFSIMTCCAKKCFSKKSKNGKEGEGEDDGDGDNGKQKKGAEMELAVHMNGNANKNTANNEKNHWSEL